MTRIRQPILASLSVSFAVINLNAASAITLEVATKCEALVAEVFPPRVAGNPAAGSAKGSGRDEQAYYRKCVANGGRPPNDDTKRQKPQSAPNK
jgi:hypothetical protein